MIEKVKCKSYPCIGDFLLSKGYTLNMIPNARGKRVNYNFKGNEDSMKKYRDTEKLDAVFVTLGLVEADVLVGFLSYTTCSKACYLKLKNQFISKGFLYDDEYVSSVGNNNLASINAVYKSKTIVH